eukprot:4408511-Pyramimonas_sp.AAC.1
MSASLLQHMLRNVALATRVQRSHLCNPRTTNAPITARNAPIAKGSRPNVPFIPRGLSTDLAAEDARAQDYYDSEDAYNFYADVWGGDNIHV